ncbi:hypothetical protein J6590_056627 [Homalodisca vitripennis]|nr:hypothetical protein J6590_056627 [Homalodisca vitripennis]
MRGRIANLVLQLTYVIVQITALRVPEEVRNGSESGAILDCEYTLKQSELAPDSGLVVKWFWNNSPAPVYQWIPGQRPQDLGVLKGRLKLDYKSYIPFIAEIAGRRRPINRMMARLQQPLVPSTRGCINHLAMATSQIRPHCPARHIFPELYLPRVCN